MILIKMIEELLHATYDTELNYRTLGETVISTSLIEILRLLGPKQ